MIKTTARLITTLDCNRKCHYCCNTTTMLAQAKNIYSLAELDDYSEICITGGEPMLYPEETYNIIKELRRPGRKIYLYTALANNPVILFQMLSKGLDGIHYTIHYCSDDVETIIGILEFEYLQDKFPEKSFRMYIDQEVKFPVQYTPCRWSRVESFKAIESCPLPAHEDLFILEEKK